MSDAAAKDMGTFVERLLAGWPVYGVVLVFLAGYSELYIEKKISDGIKAETGQTSTVTEISKDVALNTDAIEDLSDDIGELTTTSRELNADVKATLRILANQ